MRGKRRREHDARHEGVVYVGDYLWGVSSNVVIVLLGIVIIFLNIL